MGRRDHLPWPRCPNPLRYAFGGSQPPGAFAISSVERYEPNNLGVLLAGLFTKLRVLFGGAPPATDEENDAAAARIGVLFRKKHTNFRLLLTSGKRLLSTLSDMERALTDGRVFGMTFLRAGTTGVAVNAFRMLTHLRELDSGAAERLSARFTELLARIEEVLGRRGALASGELIVNMAQVHAARADEVGARLAELGEVKNRLGLPVPEGFVIGGRAYDMFANYQGLREEIERLLQAFNVGACTLAQSEACLKAAMNVPDTEDEGTVLSVEEVGISVARLIEDWPMPPELEQALAAASSDLALRTGATRVTLIPASMGEGQAFVGRYPAQFGVPLSDLPTAYRKAIAGKYSPEAMLCRLWRGMPDVDVFMCVGVLAEPLPPSSAPAAAAELAPGALPYARGLALSRSRVLPGADVPEHLAGVEAVRILTIAAPGRNQHAAGACPVILACPGTKENDGCVHYCAADDSVLSDDFSLSEEQSLTLGRLARDLEIGLGAPVEFEWRLGPDGCFEVLRCGPQFAPSEPAGGSLPVSGAGGGHSRMEGTPVHKHLGELLELMAPQTLPAPEDPGFRAANCQTVRDVARLAHQRAVDAMFSFGRSQQDFSERQAKQLWAGGSAMQWWIINLEDAFSSPPEGKFVRLENISSPPFHAVWEGISAVPWAGPPPVDARGFLSIMYESTTNPEISITGDFDFGVQNHILLSKSYVSLSSRFGYHFVTIEALVGDRARENFVSFQFRGGAAEMTRRARRIQFVSGILREYGFSIDVQEDALTARVESLPTAELMDRLRVLGYLIIHTRQLDMIMRIPEQVRLHREKILREIAQMLAPGSGKAA